MAGHVLIIDDDDRIREMLTEVVKGLGYTVATAATAANGLDAAHERRPDVVLLDLHLPGALSGEAVVPKLAALTRVVVVTGADEGLAPGLVRDGAYGFISKPVSIHRLAQVIREATSAPAAPDAAALRPPAH
jgi:DNA-binding NtrC family response regulator